MKQYRFFSLTKKILLLVLFLLTSNFKLTAQSQILPFFEPAINSGTIEVKLYPTENVPLNTPVKVTFGVPFTRGSLPINGLTKIRLLTSTNTNIEIPIHVKLGTTWHHMTNTTIDNQFVRTAIIQLEYRFSSSYPNSEKVYLQYGNSDRNENISSFTPARQAWHQVIDGDFVSTDNVYEPDVYAVLSKEYLSNGALKLSRLKPFNNEVPLTRENPSVVETTTYTSYEAFDHSQLNFFFSIINEDDPLVTNPNKCLFRTDSEPWLYDRATAIYNLYMKSGNFKVLRAAVRNSQFYKNNLYDDTTLPSNAIGNFKLKNPIPSNYIGNNGAMYSYNECLAYTYWLTGDDSMLQPIEWVVNAYETNNPPTRWSPNAGSWTERFTAFRLLSNVIAYEITGNPIYRNAMTTQTNDLIWHQNGADGELPSNRIVGGLYHYGSQHGDGTATELVASPWMSTLLSEAMLRYYGVSETNAAALFIKRIADFQKVSLKIDTNHMYNSENPNGLWYPDYMTRFDGTTDERDGTAIEHSLDLSISLAWGAYFSGILNNVVDQSLFQSANNTYDSYLTSMKYWIRPAGPSTGRTAYRVTPWRKYGWEFTPSVSYTWLMNQFNEPLSVTNPIKNEIVSLFPNPFSNNFFLKNNTSDTLLITVNDLSGKMVNTYTTNEFLFNINTELWSKGVYFIKITNGKEIQFSKLLKI